MIDKVRCAKCGKQFEADVDEDSNRRTPCPSCGSTARNISVSVSDTIVLSTSMDAILVKSTQIDFLLKTIIVPGAKSIEGRIIEAIAIPWFEIIALLKKDPAVAYEIPPDKWEEIVAGAYKRAGFDEVTLTPRSGDLGRDVIAIKKGIGQVRVVDQVKAYKPGHFVTANDVRALMGVLQGDSASKGFLTTTSDFAPKIKDDPLIIPFIPSRLELINGPTLFKRLEELSGKNEYI